MSHNLGLNCCWDSSPTEGIHHIIFLMHWSSWCSVQFHSCCNHNLNPTIVITGSLPWWAVFCFLTLEALCALEGRAQVGLARLPSGGIPLPPLHHPLITRFYVHFVNPTQTKVPHVSWSWQFLLPTRDPPGRCPHVWWSRPKQSSSYWSQLPCRTLHSNLWFPFHSVFKSITRCCDTGWHTYMFHSHTSCVLSTPTRFCMCLHGALIHVCMITPNKESE